jgi:GntR family transcriptional regulator / MocR family aminotransferase
MSPVLPGGLDLFLEIPRRGTRRRALEDSLRAAIREGRLAPGTRLPSTRSLSAELGLSRGTVAQAYEQLAAEGWLTARTRSGTRVAGGAAPLLWSRADHVSTPTPPRYDLRPGRPDASAFPRGAWATATRFALREAPADAFGFGDPRGRPELRSALAAYLGRVRGVRVDPAHLVICSGYTQALTLLADVFAELGVGTVGMEDPGIGDHVATVAARMRVADIDVDCEGMSCTELAASEADVAVCTPAHQFPLGVSMSPGRRSGLLRWAESRHGWIIEDDYDGEFRYDRRPVGALQSRQPSRVVYVGSVSKTLGPAVRLGWIACPPSLLEPLAEAKRRARPTGSLDQLALARLIDTGDYDRHLRASRGAYRDRRDLLAEAVRTRLPGARVLGIEAGLHVILELPAGYPGEDTVAAALRDASVWLDPLGAYTRRSPVCSQSRPALVVGYAAPPAHSYRASINALTEALRRLAAC